MQLVSLVTMIKESSLLLVEVKDQGCGLITSSIEAL
jgi:hypothetical protein